MPSDWKSGYCASVTIRNTGSSATTSWGMVIGLNGSTLNHAWNTRITPSDGQLRAVNESYNGRLDPGASTMWGFCGSGTGRPTLVAVDGSGGPDVTTSTSVSSSVGSGGGAGVGGSGGEGGEGGGSTTTTTAGTGGEGGAGGGTTTAGTGGEGGEGGEGGGSTTTTTAGTGGDGGGSTTTTTAGTGGDGGGSTTTGGGGEGGAGGGSTTAGAGGAPPLDPACGPDTAAFADVAPILEKSCANQFCHGNPTSPAGRLDLRTSTAVGALVNRDAGSCSSEKALVVPFMPSSSYLMNKLKDVGLCDPDESSMPPGSSLPEADLKTINDWICAGAPDR
ncbi:MULTISPECIES: cellulose binding domain-containing protein [Sorangium]|uniref:cellulose binding domain-containing protein n=1 Tax=Sorangium TaxID=39643 RepID=UPI001EECF5AA|nr:MULTISPECIES: cellulose binding domain-containing protein [Sorangium]